MTKQVVLLFAGQGSQAVGMGRDFYENFDLAKSFFEKADQQLGFSLSETMFSGPDSELMRTSICQPALFVHGYIGCQLLRQCLPDLDIAYAAGLSLGEFTAHACAGSVSFEVGLDLVAKRGRYMEEAANQSQGAMAVMNGSEEPQVRELADRFGVEIANLNTPTQLVISGPKDKIEAAVEAANQEELCGTQMLNVAGAFHSGLMASAQEKLAHDLETLAVNRPVVPVVSNVTAEPVTSPEAIRQTLRRQVTESVHWSRSMSWLVDQGEFDYIQLGPGKSIAGLMRRNCRGVKVAAIEDTASLERAVGNLA